MLDAGIVEELEDLYSRHRDYLVEFNEPRLLHGDLCSDNVIVSLVAATEGGEVAEEGRDRRVYELSGIVDFCDVITGDPLYDFAEILGITADWKDMRGLLEGYGRNLTEADMQVVHLYGAFLCVYFMVHDDGETIRDKDSIGEYLEKLSIALQLTRTNVFKVVYDSAG